MQVTWITLYIVQNVYNCTYTKYFRTGPRIWNLCHEKSYRPIVPILNFLEREFRLVREKVTLSLSFLLTSSTGEHVARAVKSRATTWRALRRRFLVWFHWWARREQSQRDKESRYTFQLPVAFRGQGPFIFIWYHAGRGVFPGQRDPHPYRSR